MNTVSNFFLKAGIDLTNGAHRKKLLLAAVLLVLVVCLLVKNFGGGQSGTADAADPAGTVLSTEAAAQEDGAAAVSEGTGQSGQSSQSVQPDAGSGSEAAAGANSDIYVDVSGAVVKPCVVCLPAGSRVFDAVEAAGGLSELADTRTINQAAVLTDGEKIYVPTEDEVEAGTVPATANDTAAPGGAGVSSGGGDAVRDGKIDINKASAEDLQQLSGIGPALSQRIIDYRDAHGAFKKTEDMKNVSGIGDKTFEKFRDVITV
jgi:competence protein ComEA